MFRKFTNIMSLRKRALSALLNQSVSVIDTPTLVVDLDAMDRNLQKMANYAANIPHMKLRPHAKMHKSVALAKRQIEAGAVGICVQKVILITLITSCNPAPPI